MKFSSTPKAPSAKLLPHDPDVKTASDSDAVSDADVDVHLSRGWVTLQTSGVDSTGEDPSETYSERSLKRVHQTHQRMKFLSEEKINGVLSGIQRLDRLLMWIDRLLYKTQPPTSGRIRLEWKRSQDDPSRFNPRWVQWIHVGGSRWRCEPLGPRPARSVRSAHGFQTHRSEVIELVKIGSEALKHRAVLMGYLADLGRGWTQKERHLSEAEDHLLGRMFDVVDAVNAKVEDKINLDIDLA